MKSISPCVRRAQTFLIALLASSAVFTAGCANMATTAVGSSSQAVALGGTIHGGNFPVTGATVQLWFAGQGGPAVLAATTSTTGFGTFSFASGSYTCPVQTNSPYVYVTAYGGNTQGTGTHSNAAAVFVAPYGVCTSLSSSSFVNMTEVTTVATMAALQQYFVSSSATTGVYTGTGGYFSTSGSGLSYQSMGIAFNTIQNMVDIPSGAAISPITGKTINGDSGGIGSSGTSLVATPESAKINTIANILASCVNFPDYSIPSSPPTTPVNTCDMLFAYAAPPASASTTAQPNATFTSATNTLQAAYYMLSNPTNGSTSNLTNLFALAPAAGAPFQPTLPSTATPSDWTIAISYASSSTCNGVSSSHLIHSVQDIAVDAGGNIWLANNEAGGNLTALEAIDNGQAFVPAACVQIGSGKNTGITIDALPASNTGLANIWLADSGASNVYKYHPTSAASSATAFSTSAAPASIAADGTGNIYYTVPTKATLYEITGANGTTPGTAVSIATSIGASPTRVIVDSAPSIWTTSGAASVTHTVCTTPNTATGCTSTSIAPAGPTYGVAATAIYTLPGPITRNSIFISQDGTSDSVTLYQGLGTTYNQVTGWPVGSQSNPAAVAADGAQNVWSVNNLNNANSVFEMGVGQQPLSPAAGFQKTATFLGSARSLAIDSSGNVWIGLDGANSVTEIVGAAVPVVQPFSAALKASPTTFQTIP